jgi:hypothetical protein
VTIVNLTASDALSGLWANLLIQTSGWGFSVLEGITAADATVEVPAPYDHANDGVHAITFKQYDVAGNLASKTFYVRIDTVRPTVSAAAHITARLGGTVTLKYRVNDAANGAGAATVKVAVLNSRGHTVAVWKLGTVKTNKSASLMFPSPSGKGKYTCVTYATDLAGNVQQNVGLTTLTVK